MPSARKSTQQKDGIVFCWDSKLNWSCCDLISAAEGREGTGVDEGGGVVVGEGSDELTRGLAGHGDCVSDKDLTKALILGFAKGWHILE